MGMFIMERWQMLGDWLVALITGAILGGAYFGGLWWTVRRMPHARRPAALYVASLVLRAALLLLVVYLVLMQMGVVALMAMLCGFVMIRAWMLHRLANEGEPMASLGGPSR